MEHTNVWKLYVTYERVRTRYIPVGHYQAILGFKKSLIDGQWFMITEITSLFEDYQRTISFIIIYDRV